jgi:hypothetical protein
VAANLEVRVPFTVVRSRSALSLRAEALAFADAAFLWSRPDSSHVGQGLSPATALGPEMRELRQHRIRSVGAGVRLNALGMILEVDVVKPLDRLRNGWTVGLYAKPGF